MAVIKDSTIQDLDELHRKSKGIRSRFEPTWFLNVAYYSGDQWIWWNRGRLDRPRLDPWRVTFTDNRLLGIVRTEIAKMTKQRPIFTVTPRTADAADVQSANMAETVLSYLWDRLGLTTRQRAVLKWSRVCGAGFWKVYWDRTLGDAVDVVIGPDGQPVMGNNGRPITADALQQLPPGLKTKRIALGDVCVEVRSPFEIFPDPLASEEGIDSAEWLIEETVQSIAYVQSRYGVELPADAEAIPGVAESRMMGSAFSGSEHYYGVKVREYWHPPGSTHPDGRYAVWAGGKLLYEAGCEYKKLPYVMFPGVPVPGRFWPTSVVEQLRPVQTELNKTRSQIRENAARIGNPSLLKSRYANVQYFGVPGEEVLYDDTTPNSVPQYLQPPEMPAYVINETEAMENSLREISGQHEVTTGTVPSGVTAASAINLLLEQDDTRLGPDITAMEDALSEAGKKVLDQVAKYYDDQRTIRIAGEDGAWNIFDFRGAAIEDSTDVNVQAGSAFPQSKAAKQAAMESILTLFIQNGIPLPARDLAKYLRDMEVGGVERLIAQFSANETQVNRENMQMSQGIALPINSYDDDEAHIDGHQEFMKGATYQRIVQMVGPIFEGHVQAHQQRQQQQQEAQQNQQIQLAERMAEAEAKARPPQQRVNSPNRSSSKK